MGPSPKVRAIANTLLGTKGVKHDKLVTTTGTAYDHLPVDA